MKFKIYRSNPAQFASRYQHHYLLAFPHTVTWLILGKKRLKTAKNSSAVVSFITLGNLMGKLAKISRRNHNTILPSQNDAEESLIASLLAI